MSILLNRREVKCERSNKMFQHLIKRTFDIVFSFIALLILSPLFLILAILIIKEDGRPIFFKQPRSGLNRKTFKMFKLRSMKNKQIPVASNSHNSYNWTNGVPENFIFKTASENNPNVTKVGKYIRKYSLDE